MLTIDFVSLGGEFKGMTRKAYQCPDCHDNLKPIVLADLVGELKAGGAKLVHPAINAIFDYFDFWVCPRCGLTVIYAGPEARAKAAGVRAKKSAGILGLD